MEENLIEQAEVPTSLNQRVLLINPAFEFEPQDTKMYVFPFGLGYVAGSLRERGHTVDVWDIHAQLITFKQAEADMPAILAKGYTHIGITGIVNQYLYIKKLVEIMRPHTDALITVGGPLATYSYDLLLRETQVDLCVLGSGEYTYGDVVSGRNWRETRGLAFLNDEKNVVALPGGKFPRDLDSLSAPAYDLFDVEFYLKKNRLMTLVHPWYRNRKIAALVTARGCPYKCTFCSKSIRKVALHGIDYVIDQIRFFMKEYGVDAIIFEDELLVLSKERTLDFCKEIGKLNIIWNAQARVNLVDREMLLAMKESGCTCIGFGIESGSQRILDAMKKKITVEQIKDVLNICKEIGLAVKVQLIYGYPGEDANTLQETIDLFKELRYPGCRMSIITPLPGSAVYEDAKSDGFIGDSEEDTISEIDFLEYLSLNGGMCQRHFFYNRTAFSDEEFLQRIEQTHKLFLWNFAKSIILHPIDIVRYWRVYKCYIRHWLNYYRGDFKKKHFRKQSQEILKTVKGTS